MPHEAEDKIETSNKAGTIPGRYIRWDAAGKSFIHGADGCEYAGMNDADLKQAQEQVEKRLREVLLAVDGLWLRGYRIKANIRGNRLISTELRRRDVRGD